MAGKCSIITVIASFLKIGSCKESEKVGKAGGGMTKAEELVALLKARGMTVTAAESCTGGLVAASIVGVSGASEVFPGSVVSYATRVKEELLSVDPCSVEAHTVVSAPVAREMAAGARRLLRADVAVSVTGLAGPGGGTEEIPVGTVFVGVATEKGCDAYRFSFAGDREAVRRAAADAALEAAIFAVKNETNGL